MKMRFLIWLILVFGAQELISQEASSHLEGIRERFPEPKNDYERRGPAIEVAPGKFITVTLLDRLADEVPVRKKEDFLFLLTHMRDSDIAIRYVSTKALISALKAHKIDVQSIPTQCVREFKEKPFQLLLDECVSGVARIVGEE